MARIFVRNYSEIKIQFADDLVIVINTSQTYLGQDIAQIQDNSNENQSNSTENQDNSTNEEVPDLV